MREHLLLNARRLKTYEQNKGMKVYQPSIGEGLKRKPRSVAGSQRQLGEARTNADKLERAGVDEVFDLYTEAGVGLALQAVEDMDKVCTSTVLKAACRH